MPSRRSFLHVLSASLVLGLPKGKLLAEYVNGSLESGDAVYGNYGFGQNHFIGLDHFTTDAGEDTLLFSDYSVGVVRRLFRVSDDQYVMGPGFAVQAPVELTLRLLRDSKGHVLRIALRSEDGVERIGKPTSCHQRGHCLSRWGCEIGWYADLSDNRRAASCNHPVAWIGSTDAVLVRTVPILLQFSRVFGTDLR